MEDTIQKVLDYFEKINAIPRCSKNEARICQWLQDWAEAHQFDTRKDSAGNMVVHVPASGGYHQGPTVVLQGHMDMVCEKTPESTHDFKTDPIVSTQQGDWLTAQDTTLGADNGIAIAYALVLAESNGVNHPPLELLFTVDEESGLNGVKVMEPGLITGSYLINIDSEDEGVFTVGCAGGVDTELTLDLQTASVPDPSIQRQVTIGGLAGGHSGIDIHLQRGNANKILARSLWLLRSMAPIHLVDLKGGSRHNAIPRDAHAVIAFAPNNEAAVEEALSRFEKSVRQEYDTEPNLFVRMQPVQSPSAKAFTLDATDRAIWLLMALPHGVAGMSTELPGLVETSSNLATTRIKNHRLTILSSQRSSVMSRLDEITASVHAVAQLAGAATRDENDYPAWQPDMQASLLNRAKTAYRRLFDQDPVVQVIHAGLECAIIGENYSGMEMISVGPTIKNPHSPDERLHLPSVGRVWHFLVALLAEMKSTPLS